MEKNVDPQRQISARIDRSQKESVCVAWMERSVIRKDCIYYRLFNPPAYQTWKFDTKRC